MGKTGSIRTLGVLIILTVIIVIMAYTWGPERRFVVEEDHSLPREPANGDPLAGPPSSFWFAPDGSLIAVWEYGNCVFLRKDNLDTGATDRKHFDFARVASEPDLTVKDWLGQRANGCDPNTHDGKNPQPTKSTESGVADPPTSEEADASAEAMGQPAETTGEAVARSLPVYAISETGDSLTWLSGQDLYLLEDFTPPDSQKVKDLIQGRPRTRLPIRHLAFMGPALISFIDDDGRLGFWSYSPNNSAQLAFGTHFAGTTPVQSRGSVLAAPFFTVGDLGVVQFDGPGQFNLRMYQLPFWDGAVLALSPSGVRVVVGSSSGNLWREDLQEIALSGPPQAGAGPSTKESSVLGAVHALAFVDDERVLVGGDFEGLWLVDWQGEPEKIYGNSQGVLRLAASREHIAYATATTVKVASYRKPWRSDAVGEGIVGGLLGSIFLALVGKLWSLRKPQ